jgi:sensor histidine kinase YesM
MKVLIGRNSIRLLLCINLFVIVVQLVLAAADRRDSRELLQGILFSLVYANITVIPAMLIMPRLFERLTARRFPLLLVLILCPVIFILTGCLIAQTLLWWTGALRLQHFWLYYLRTLPFVLSAGLIFGLGAFIYGSMQERLHDTERKLHEKAVAEERAQKLAAEARLRSLESRLHPHFLFNALNSISSLVVENPVLAERMVGRLAALLRSSLDNTNQSMIPLQQETAMVKDYLEIEKIRFGDKLRGQVNVPEELQDTKIPPLSILSLVENAVKHGITRQRSGGECLVTAFMQESNGNLLIEVCDTGPGFDLAAIGAGHGLDNLVERLNTLFGERAFLKVFQRDGWCVVQMGIPRP